MSAEQASDNTQQVQEEASSTAEEKSSQVDEKGDKMSIKQALKMVNQRMQMAIQRRSMGLPYLGETRLVAVSKFKPVEMILEAYEAGQRHFGENYVEELLEKSVSEPIVQNCPDIRWHFIGHLQSNKVNKLLAVRNLFLVETIDSFKIADAINKRLEGRGDKQKVYIQVNTSREPNKSGVSPEEAELLYLHVRNQCPNLQFAGIMTIGSYDHTYSDGDNPDFITLAELRKNLCTKFKIFPYEIELSMGMSHDFENAIELGATNVRVGSLIFGERDNKK